MIEDPTRSMRTRPGLLSPCPRAPWAAPSRTLRRHRPSGSARRRLIWPSRTGPRAAAQPPPVSVFHRPGHELIQARASASVIAPGVPVLECSARSKPPPRRAHPTAARGAGRNRPAPGPAARNRARLPGSAAGSTSRGTTSLWTARHRPQRTSGPRRLGAAARKSRAQRLSRRDRALGAAVSSCRCGRPGRGRASRTGALAAAVSAR